MSALEAREVTAVQNDGEQTANGWRVGKYVELGFTLPQAEALAEARDDLGFALYWGDVAAQLERGCSHDDAFLIYS